MTTTVIDKNTRAQRLVKGWRLFAASTTAAAFLFVINNFLTHAASLPGPRNPETTLAWLQLLAYPATITALALYTLRHGSLNSDAAKLEAVAQYIPRAAFFAVLFIGIADFTLSLLHIENLSDTLLPAEIAQGIAHSQYRAQLHYPLLVIAALVALRKRGAPFVWLTLLIVAAELLIVIARFVFSYEQPFMGDLVRFWYAALFLFAAAYTLKEDGHVRVDVLYAGFSPKAKARANAAGVLLLGLPLCWTILALGLATRSSAVNAPILNFEITQSSAGLHVKYFMAAFLLVFALSMTAQFAAMLLRSAHTVLAGEDPAEPADRSSPSEHPE